MSERFLDKVISDIRKYLPLQNPLSSFIHNNILMNFEDLHFEDGLKYASFYYGSRIFKDENFYLKEFKNKRIDEEELIIEIERFLANNKEFQKLPNEISQFHFYEMLLLNPVSLLKEENILWRIQNDTEDFLTENITEDEKHNIKKLVRHWLTSATEEQLHEIIKEPELNDFPRKYLNLTDKSSFREQLNLSNDKNLELLILWCICHVEAKKAFQVDCEHFEIKTFRRKKFFKKLFNEDLDNYTNPLLVRILATYLDQGMSYWQNPYKTEGLWVFFNDFIHKTDFNAYVWMDGFKTILKNYQDVSLSDVIENELRLTQLNQEHWKDYILENLYDIRGWSGIVNKMETETQVAPVKSPNIKLEELIAIKLICERVVNEYLLKKYHLELKNEQLETYYKFKTSLLQNAYIVFHVMKHLSVPMQRIIDYNEEDIKNIIHQTVQFTDNFKTSIWHYAYEKSFYHKGLSALYIHNKDHQSKKQTIDCQIMFCIDDREESIRRYIEDIDKAVETLGVVGFFGLDMNFVSVAHPRKLPHCPPVVKPITTILEVADTISLHNQKIASNNRNKFGKFILGLYFNSRTLIRAQLATFLLGFLSFLPLSFKIYHPLLARKIKKYFYKYLFPEIKTHLDLLCFEPTAQQRHGYTKNEMADRIHTILSMTGSVKNFPPLVVLMAHGSSSSNNPFQLAYGCGACSGRSGAPNSRAFALMVNDKEVREILRTKKGIDIPDSCYFLGAFHDTCTDGIQYLDLHLLPSSHREIFERVSRNLKSACELNAYERIRRFANIKVKHPKEALLHVETRAHSIAEPRPEYGHSTVAMCVIGKRDLTKNLFLDRRSFLISYDPATDPEGKILLGVMAAAVPVCANISLDYFFSTVDSEKYGCGSKLPLNVTSLMGVMTGSSSDLRIGLAEQMVEIHEPMRITIVYETTTQIMDSILSQSKKLSNLIKNFWIRTVIYDYITKEMYEYTAQGWVKYQPKYSHLPTINNYTTYIKNKKTNLEFVRLAE